MNKIFGERLKELRIQNYRRLRKFAELIGMNIIELSRIENGIEAPPQDEKFIKKVIFWLNLNFDEAEELKKLWKKSFKYRKQTVDKINFIKLKRLLKITKWFDKNENK